jgi:hypothetical protein
MRLRGAKISLIWGVDMLNFLLAILAHVLTWGFAIGLAGCLLVIPITAYRLLSVLFEKDHPDEIDPSLPVAEPR